MTEIEEVKAQIKVLEKKLSFLEELEQTKSPVEEAYKRVYGNYPDTGIGIGFSYVYWDVFQKAYEQAQKDYKVGEYQEPEVEPSMTNCVITGNPPDGYVTWQEWYNELGSKGILHKLRISSIEQKKVQEEQEVCEWDVIREAVDQGVIPPVEKKQKTLTDLIERWWSDVFTTHSDWDMETSIEDLVDQIELFLPKEQSAAGSQNAYVESAVEGFNDAIKQIKSKLR